MKTTNDDLISVVLCTFNSGPYIKAAINSLRDQTYKNIEIIVVDDGSSDATISITRSLKEIDARVNILEKAHSGISDSRNQGIAIANGKYIAIMDSDDLARKTRLARQMEFLNNNKLDVCGSAIRTFGRFPRKTLIYPASVSEARTHVLFNSPIANPTAFGLAKTFQRYLLANEWSAAEDFEVYSKMINAGLQIASMGSIELDYRIHRKQVSWERRLVQESQRTRLCRLNWEVRGKPYPFKSALNFSNVSEVRMALDLLYEIGNEISMPIVISEMLRMLRKTPGDRREYKTEMQRLPMSPRQRMELFYTCLSAK